MSAPVNYMQRSIDPAAVMRAMRDQGAWADRELDEINAAILRYTELVDSLPALIDIAAGQAPVSRGVIRRAEAALAAVQGCAA